MMRRVTNPVVILWDLAPPYDRNWAFLQLLRTTVLKGRRLVLTTTNKAQVERLTKEASRARATR
jgi:hypothetical protein